MTQEDSLDRPTNLERNFEFFLTKNSADITETQVGGLRIFHGRPTFTNNSFHHQLIEAYGLAQGSIAFEMSQTIDYWATGGKTERTHWYLSNTDGPIQHLAHYFDNTDYKEWLWLEFARTDILVFGRGGSYDPDGSYTRTNSLGKSLLGDYGTIPSQGLHDYYPGRHASDLVEEQIDNEVQIIVQDNQRSIETITVPSQIDFAKWRQNIVQDPLGKALDPTQPYFKWFDELGIKFQSNYPRLPIEDSNQAA